MSVHATSAVWKTRVGDSSAKLVLLKLADNANDAGVAWPSRQTLARECEMSEKTVDRKLEFLVDAGLISKHVRHTPKGRQTSNLYRLLVVDSVDGSCDGSGVPQDDAPEAVNLTPAERQADAPHEGEGVNLTPLLTDAELEVFAAQLRLSPAQRRRWFVPGDRPRVSAWAEAWHNPPQEIRSRNAWVVRGVEGHDFPPVRTPKSKPCPDCGVGAGQHAIDCPSAPKPRPIADVEKTLVESLGMAT
jgi:Helix-turn-helix domain